jgi:ABC-2 type transport system permease protein
MSRLWPVVRREYLERVRSKAFVIGTFIGPALMAGLMVVPSLVMARQRGRPLRVAVADATGTLRAAVEAALSRKKAAGEKRFVIHPAGDGPVDEVRARFKADVLEGRLDGYLFLPEDALARSSATYHGKNVSNFPDLRLVEESVEEVLIARRLANHGLDPRRVKDLVRRLDLTTVRLSASGERLDKGGTFIFSTTLMMMLYVTVLMWGQALMLGVIEEKSNRIVEVAVSSLSSGSLLAGKLIGVGAAGLTQFLVWSASMAGFAIFAAQIPGPSGFMPEVTPQLVVSFVGFFLLGYFLYGALYVAIGAAVNTQQEAQSLVFPAIAPLVTATLFFPAVLSSPDSTLSTVLSLIPLLTPLLMFLRITVVTPPLWQIGLSVVLTLLTIALVNWAAARIYRVGILMYGKRPTFPELLRWVRHS